VTADTTLAANEGGGVRFASEGNGLCLAPIVCQRLKSKSSR